MPLSMPTIYHYGSVVAIVLLLLFAPQLSVAQGSLPITKDSTSGKRKSPLPDSTLQQTGDFLKKLPAQTANQLKNKAKTLKQNLTSLPGIPVDTSGLILPNQKLFDKPLIAFKGGYVNYTYNYRSNIDTPFAEKDIGQHNVTGSLAFTAGNVIPLRLNYWVRRSNSALFQDVTDAQLVFDAAGFRNNLTSNLQKRLQALAPNQYDSLLQQSYNAKLKELQSVKSWISSPFNIQNIRSYREIIQVPSLTYKMDLPDSINKKRADSIQQLAKTFIALYDTSRKKYEQLTGQVDSLEKQVNAMHARMQRYRQIVGGKFSDWTSYTKWRDELKEYRPDMPGITEKYNWLMGVRNFSLGKSPVNYSELTAKNINVTGINFEYNSWYYVAVTAGVVDYRFRDFVINRFNRTPQYLYMVRLGIGRIESNYFILSAFRGRKQLYASTGNSSHSTVIDITGFSAETKWRLNKTTYIIAEAAESLSPDYRSSPAETSNKFTFSNSINKALSVKAYTYLPKTASRLEGMYKYTGANFQSFSSFQTNAAVRSWYIKWEQPFFKRKLRITGALRSNEFTNPYIVQQYKSNTVFKSITAVFRARKWPTVTVGYIPMSQLTVVGQQLLENRFQSLTASLSHFYKIGRQRTASTLVLNQFYNTSSDTGFIYFNATNVYFSQQLIFNAFTANLGISHSRNNGYELNVLEETLNFYVFKQASLGFGVKINNFNKQQTKLGGAINANIPVTKRDMLFVSYEKGYLPGNNKQLVANDMAMIQYSRFF